MWSAGAVKGHRKRLRGRMTNDTCIRCIVMIFLGGQLLGESLPLDIFQFKCNR